MSTLSYHFPEFAIAACSFGHRVTAAENQRQFGVNRRPAGAAFHFIPRSPNGYVRRNRSPEP